MLERYVIHEDEDGTFDILDAKTFEVVERSGLLLQELEWHWVDTVMDVLESLDRHRERPN